MELKFRAKANIDNEWRYASNIHKVILDNTKEELWVIHPKGEKIEHLGDGYIKYRPLVVDKETISQYTGLKDKSDKEIYVGDILKVKNEMFPVVQADVYTGTEGKDITVEVIGNIHENKDLFK